MSNSKNAKLTKDATKPIDPKKEATEAPVATRPQRGNAGINKKYSDPADSASEQADASTPAEPPPLTKKQMKKRRQEHLAREAQRGNLVSPLPTAPPKAMPADDQNDTSESDGALELLKGQTEAQGGQAQLDAKVNRILEMFPKELLEGLVKSARQKKKEEGAQKPTDAEDEDSEGDTTDGSTPRSKVRSRRSKSKKSKKGKSRAAVENTSTDDSDSSDSGRGKSRKAPQKRKTKARSKKVPTPPTSSDSDDSSATDPLAERSSDEEKRLVPRLQRTTLNKFNRSIDSRVKRAVKKALDDRGIKFKPNAMTRQRRAHSSSSSSSSSEDGRDKKKAGKKRLLIGQHYGTFVAFQRYFDEYVEAGHYGAAIKDETVRAKFYVMLRNMIHENNVNGKCLGDNWRGVAEVLDRHLYRISKRLQTKHSVESRHWLEISPQDFFRAASIAANKAESNSAGNSNNKKGKFNPGAFCEHCKIKGHHTKDCFKSKTADAGAGTGSSTGGNTGGGGGAGRGGGAAAAAAGAGAGPAARPGG